MAKKRYPVVDILTCSDCGICVNSCSNGVFNKEKFPVPIVVHPEACVDHCHNCGNNCPVGAIAYVGDDTGWQPRKTENAGKELQIEYLYLDLTTCDRCLGTDAVLDEVVAVLKPALELAGYTVVYKKCEMTTAKIAEQYKFLSSPTIRVNGADIFGEVKESDCGCCGDIAGVAVDCRVFEYEGKTYEVPTKEMLADLILKNLHATSTSCGGAYELPENLKRFYEGKERRTASCSCGCCCNC